MVFKNSLKIEFEKGFSPFTGRRLASGPPAEAGPRSTPPHAAPSPWPSPTRAPGLPQRRAVPVPARRARPRQDALAAWPPCAGDARRAAAPACLTLHALAFICCPRCAPHFTLPLAQKQRQQQRAPALTTERRRCPTDDVPILPRLLSSIPAASSSALGPCLACARLRLPSSR